MIDLTGLALMPAARRRLAFAGRLREAMELRSGPLLTGLPIVVGGAAVEFYTTGGYATQDLDLVLFNTTQAESLLRESGFDREGRYWFRDDLGLVLEFPGKTLTYAPDAYDRVAEVMVDGSRALVIGIEDILVGRLYAGIIEHRANDLKWAREMALLHGERIDWSALMCLAEANGAAVAAAVADLQRELGR